MPGESAFLHLERQGNRAVVVFVHGLFGHYRDTWGRFLELVLADRALTHCDVVSFGYPTGVKGAWFRFVGAALPPISQVADHLRSELATRLVPAYDEIVLVGHSMGGLVVQRALLDALAAGASGAALLARVRAVLLYAAPCRGVDGGEILRLHGQARDLDETSDFIEALQADWAREVTGAAPGSPAAAIRVLPVVGLQDNAVPEASARGAYRECDTVPGDHVAMCKPDGPGALAFQVLRREVLGATTPEMLDGHAEILEAIRGIAASAREVIYAIGSRSRDEAALRAIEARLAADPAVVYYRILFGPPRRRQLVEHLVRVLGSRDPSARPGGIRNIFVARYDRLDEQPEINLIGNEHRCLVVLPPRRGLGVYATARVFGDAETVAQYRSLAQQMFAARGLELRTPADVQALPMAG